MIADLKPYPKYRSAEGGWLGDIPSHWTVRRMKYVVRETDARSTRGKEQLLRISQYTGVTQRRRADGIEEPDTRADSLVGYKRVEPNDLVINIMLAWNGSMGVSRFSGIASPAYCVYRFRHDLHPWYFHNLLRSPRYKARIKTVSTGVVESRLRLYSDDLCRIEAILPTPAEQAAIVRFLDWANGRLERAVRAKRKVIALLNEQKQAIIHRAVTRGLDPSVPLKPSGIPWLGDIPQHWEVRKLRHLARQIVDGTHFTPNYRDDGVAFLRVKDIHERVIDQSKLRRISKEEHHQLSKRCNPEKGDLLLSKNGTIGVTTVVDWDFPFSIFVSLCLIKPIKSLVRPEFISFAFAGGLLVQQLADSTKTTSVTNLHLDKIRGLILPLPPLHEQSEILVKTRVEIAPIELAVSRLGREIDLLREYRTRLVADVVTGKLDVREAAARLPDEAAPDITEDETDLSLDPEAADEEAVV
jgi:type I restriction enzyme, S subunit